MGVKLCIFHTAIYGKLVGAPLNEPRSEKTGLRGFLPGPTKTGLYNQRRCLDA